MWTMEGPQAGLSEKVLLQRDPKDEQELAKQKGAGNHPGGGYWLCKGSKERVRGAQEGGALGVREREAEWGVGGLLSPDAEGRVPVLPGPSPGPWLAPSRRTVIRFPLNSLKLPKNVTKIYGGL